MWKAMSQVPGTHDKFPISSGDLFTHHRSSFLHSLITGDKLSSQHYWDTWEISWEDNSYFIIGYLWVVGLWGIVYSSFYFLNFLFFYNKHAYYKRNACLFELYSISLTFKLGPFIIFIYKSRFENPGYLAKVGRVAPMVPQCIEVVSPQWMLRFSHHRRVTWKGTQHHQHKQFSEKNLIPLFEIVSHHTI